MQTANTIWSALLLVVNFLGVAAIGYWLTLRLLRLRRDERFAVILPLTCAKTAVDSVYTAYLRLQWTHAWDILKACLPLFVSVFVMLYISNAPKYAIDAYCSDVIQNRYSILFMPAFVINLFSQFVLRPMLTPMARLWADRQLAAFRGNVLKMTAGIACITLLGVGGAWLLGIPLLKLLYRVDLSAERGILLWVMFYGGLNAVTRNQRKLAVAYGIAAAAVFFLAPAMVRRHEMAGAIGASILALGLLDLMLAGIMLYVLRKTARENGPGKAERPA